MMELFQDISNKQPREQPVKTFERRRRQAVDREESATPVSDAASPCSSSTSESPGRSSLSQPFAQSAVGTLKNHGRRSSVLWAAALPGHQLFSSNAPTSRSVLLAKMSKARRKAYLAYTQQMAEYFAQVDQFELVEESPTAATGKKARSKLTAATASGLRPTPAAWEQLEHNTALLAATPAATGSTRAVSPGNAVSSCSSLDQTRLSAAALLASPIRSPGNAIAAAAAAASAAQHELVAATPAALQAPAPTPKQASPLEAVAGHSPQAVPQQQAEEPDLLLASTPCLSSSLLAETPLQAALPDPAAAHAPGGAPRPAALQCGTPLSASLQRVSLGPQYTASQGSSGAEDSSLRRLPSIRSSLADLNLSAFTPAQQEEPAPAAASTIDANAAGAAAEAHTSCRSSSDGLPLLLMASPSPSQEDKPAASQGGRVDSSDRGESCLGANTPAASQHAELKQLVQEMQHMWMAVTPEPSQASCKAEASTRQQQRQLAAKADTAAQQRKRGTQAAAHNSAAEEELRQQQEQQQEQKMLAEQHYQAWLQKQAEAAAATELQHLEWAATAAGQLTPLQQMLQACGQSVGLQDIPSMRDFLADVVDLRDVVKIGEGTYGEAFKSGQVVLKFVPMEGSNLINGWPQKGAGDLLGEAIIARALAELGHERDEAGTPHASYTDGFVQTHRVGVCRGPYPAAFIKAWKAWDKRHKSENDAIAGLPDEQLYAVFAMANCGRDLESYKLQGYEQVRSLMLQTALALAVAEEALAFEHRDLHWGNIMLSPPHTTHITARLKGCGIKVRAEGVRVRLIDFTASRLQTPGCDVVFCDLEGEDGLFDGPKGKPQFETYRRMRKLTHKDWTGSYPGTNVLWLLYLTELLLSSEKPIPGATAAQKRNLREYKKRLSGYSCCSEVIWDELFEGLWAIVS